MRGNEQYIIHTLEKEGFQALLVGGCIRDELLGLDHNDYDIATNAREEEIRRIFSDDALSCVGSKFKVMLVNGIEVATFRSKKEQTTFKSDASLRDFTINAMGMNLNGDLFDYFGGRQDLKDKLIRAVGSPDLRIQEDPSRLLRAVYLASYLGFEIESETRRAIQEHKALLQEVPVELIGRIIEKVMKRNCLSVFVRHLKDLDLLGLIFPYLTHTIDMPQNPKYHNSNVFDHIIRVIEAVELLHPRNTVLLLSALLHDVAKGLPEVRGLNKEKQPNDLMHEIKGVPIAKKALRSLQFHRDTVQMVLFIVEHHGLTLPANPSKKSVLKALRKMATHFREKEDLEEAVDLLFTFKSCDAVGFAPAFGRKVQNDLVSIRKSFSEELKHSIFYRKELPISGSFLKEKGFEDQEIGLLLNDLVTQNLTSMDKISKIVEKKRIDKELSAMQRGQLVFSNDRLLNAEFSRFVDKIIEVSGEESVIARKDNSKLWQEHQTATTYTVETVFSLKEAECLINEYGDRFICIHTQKGR